MEQLGDIMKLSGFTMAPVDVVTGGSPCQGLSTAGKRLGLADERSGLFMEQIRLVKELRNADEARGRTGVTIRPRFMAWENVAGAFSSNKGEDFRAVLEEIARIKDSDATIPRPPKGKWATAGCIMGDGWSLAWRLHDAQFWGVPQRRRRIALVADFGGNGAAEILFERESLSGNFKARREAWEKATTGTRKGACSADGNPPVAKCLRAKSHLSYREDCDTIVCIPFNDKATRFQGGGGTRKGDGAGNGLGVGKPGDPSPTLTAGDRHGVFCAAFMGGQGEKAGGIGYDEEMAPTLKAVQSGGNSVPTVVFDARGKGCGEVVSTLTGDHQRTISDYTTLAVDCRNHAICAVSGTLQAKESGGQSLNYINPVLCVAHGQANAEILSNVSPTLNCNHEQPIVADLWVRRLTPTECERLQGYPDGWTDLGAWVDSGGKWHKESSDSARYKALGNSIALPFWEWMLGRMMAYYDEPATLGSLFDGIGGFPLCWQRVGGVTLWASEIEEFPMAVTRRWLCDV